MSFPSYFASFWNILIHPGGMDLVVYAYIAAVTMSIILRSLSGFVTMIPAMAIWLLISISAGGEYFWKSYFIVDGVFLAASFALGFFIPTLAQAHWKRSPIPWLFGQGLLAWMVAILALLLINLTPLCIGQENGDGRNDFALCMLETMLVPLVFSPLEFILLGLTSLTGGWIIIRLVKREQS